MSADPIRKIMDSASVYTVLKKARPLPLSRTSTPAEQFPAAVLGEILEGAANGIQDRTQAPLAICAQSVLAAASLATQAHADVVLPTGHPRPIGCYFMSVAASGERKSAVDHEALWPVRMREEALGAEYESDLPAYLNRLDSWESERSDI